MPSIEQRAAMTGAGTFINPWVVWLSPACERCCLLPGDREWCQDDIWGACQDCGAMAVRYALSPLREARAGTVDNREGPCPGCVNPGCRHGGCQGRKPLDRLRAPPQGRA